MKQTMHFACFQINRIDLVTDVVTVTQVNHKIQDERKCFELKIKMIMR